MGFSVGLGLTNNCDLECAHCYRPQGRVYNLSLQDIQLLCETLEVDSIGLGTGENGLNPEFLQIVAYFKEHGIPVTLASNGFTVRETPDEILKTFRDIEFSLDFPSKREQDDFRARGNWQRVLSGIERCKRLGMEVSVLAVLMNVNYNKLAALAKFVASLGCALRVNVFQPVRNRKYLPSYEQYWEGFRALFDAAELVSCTEPLVNTFSGLDSLRGSPCGRGSIRITPRKRVLPCVYWPDNELDLTHLSRLRERIWDSPPFRKAREVPEGCQRCSHVDNCRGGCRSRNHLLGKGGLPDHFCPVSREDKRRLSPTLASEKKLLRSRSICTTIVQG